MTRRPPSTTDAGHVLVVGDANIDLVLRGDVVPRFGQAEQLLETADVALGGSAGIVAAGLAALRTPVGLVARVGDDLFGRATLEFLDRCGVECSGVEVDPDLATGLSVILSPPGDRAILTLPGTIPTLRVGAVSDEMLRTSSHVHVASYFLQPDLAADLPTLLGRARAAGCTTSLDTNWDPSGAWSGVAALWPLIDVLLPNTAELRALTGGEPGAPDAADDLLDRARTLHSQGPVVAVKAGAAGGWALGPDGRVDAPALAVDVADTTGAGDSFDAGFLAAWVRGLPLEQCLRWAAGAGSLSARAAGGIAAQPSLDELTSVLA